MWKAKNAWHDLANSAATAKVRIIAIVNPEDGPGKERCGDFVEGIRVLRSAGIEVMGYIESGYGKRALGKVMEDLRRWRDFYGLTSIFVDEVAEEACHVEHYREIFYYCRQIGFSFVMLNPGLVPCPGYFDIADSVVTFEDYHKLWNRKTPQHLPPHSCVLIHNCAKAEDMHNALDQAVAAKCEYLFITDRKMPDPWDALPSYWSDFLAYAGAKAPSG